MIIIAAMSTDRLIGSGDGMPWSVPEEYRQYLDISANCCVAIRDPNLKQPAPLADPLIHTT